MATALALAEIFGWIGLGMGAIIIGVATADAIIRRSQRRW